MVRRAKPLSEDTEGWVGTKLPAALARQIDDYVATSGMGFTGRTDVVAAAVREYLERRVSHLAPGAERRADEESDLAARQRGARETIARIGEAAGKREDERRAKGKR